MGHETENVVSLPQFESTTLNCSREVCGFHFNKRRPEHSARPNGTSGVAEAIDFGEYKPL